MALITGLTDEDIRTEWTTYRAEAQGDDDATDTDDDATDADDDATDADDDATDADATDAVDS